MWPWYLFSNSFFHWKILYKLLSQFPLTFYQLQKRMFLCIVQLLSVVSRIFEKLDQLEKLRLVSDFQCVCRSSCSIVKSLKIMLDRITRVCNRSRILELYHNVWQTGLFTNSSLMELLVRFSALPLHFLVVDNLKWFSMGSFCY